MKYRKKPVVIEAFRFGIDPKPEWFLKAMLNGTVVCSFCDSDWQPELAQIHSYCEIETLEGTHQGNWGDYIIQGVKGELYPCKPDIFEMTYEEVKDE